MKRKAAALLGLALGLGLMGSMSLTALADFTPALDPDTTQTVKVLGNYDNFEALDAAAIAFQEYYPNIDVAYEKLDDYNANIGPRLASDTQAGLFMVQRYNFIENEYLPEVIADVSTLDIDFDVIDPAAYAGCYIDGKLFGIPLWYRYYGMVVNLDLLEQEGLEAPSSLSDLYACADQLLADGYVPIQQAENSLAAYLLPKLMHVVANDYSEEESAALIAGEAGSAEGLRPVFDLMFEMIEKGYISPENMAEYEDNYNAAILKFYEGETPLMVATSQTVSGMAKRQSLSEAYQANPFSYEFIYTPIGEDGPLVYKSDDTGFGLNKNCDYYDVATEFYRFIYTEETLNRFSEIKGLPSTLANQTNELYSNLPEVDEASIVTYSDIDDPTGRLQDVFEDVNMAILEGTAATTDDAIALFEELAKAQEDA